MDTSPYGREEKKVVIMHHDARIVCVTGHPSLFAVVRSTEDDMSGEHDALLERWGNPSGRMWFGPGRNDKDFRNLDGLAYVQKLEEMFVSFVVLERFDPQLVFSEFMKIDLWSEHWKR